MYYPVQHVLDAVAPIVSGATFRRILLRAVSGCCYDDGGLRNGVGRMKLRNTAAKVNGRLPFKVCHSGTAVKPDDRSILLTLRWSTGTTSNQRMLRALLGLEHSTRHAAQLRNARQLRLSQRPGHALKIATWFPDAVSDATLNTNARREKRDRHSTRAIEVVR